MSKKRNLLGLISCDVCGFEDAEVAESGSGFAYIVCDECNKQTFCRSKHCDHKLRSRMRPLASGTPRPAPKPAPESKPKPTDKQPEIKPDERSDDDSIFD